ncbi:MAG: hypothetical protein JWP91_3074 [Fibrobacteres bacterium]|nr:hypothetical protein [Fibrobacterota bacterium]
MVRSSRLLIGLLSFAAASSTAFSQSSNVWMKLFDGKDFTGWQGRIPAMWKVDTAGVIVGTNIGGPAMNGENTFLFTDSTFSDFHLKLEGRMPGSGGYRNSGIMYRSTIVNKTGYAAAGYQYEISDGGTGAFYHERGSELGFTGGCKDPSGNVSEYKKMEIIADGPHATHLMAGKSCFDYKTFKVVGKGYIGLQLHAPGDFSVNFKNIFIQPLNGSFAIPANNAWDSLGNKLNIVGIEIKAKRKTANQSLGLPGSLIGFDARGREIPAAALRWDRSGPILFDRDRAPAR